MYQARISSKLGFRGRAGLEKVYGEMKVSRRQGVTTQ